jgi:hypothetical protein
MNAERGESLAWDRVGRFLQQSATTASDIGDRNVRLWSSVSGHLKTDHYTADDMADDVAQSVATAMNNMRDVWSTLTTDPAQNTLAQPTPTAFLLFDSTGPSRHRLLEPVRIEVGSLPTSGAMPHQARVLPPRARVALSGASQDGIEPLLKRIVAYWDDNSDGYIVADINPNVERPVTAETETGSSAGEGESWSIDEGLVPGLYDGIVYLTDPPALLASVRILVEGPPPEGPIVSEAPAEPIPETKATV